jgi:hypothetical protein
MINDDDEEEEIVPQKEERYRRSKGFDRRRTASRIHVDLPFCGADWTCSRRNLKFVIGAQSQGKLRTAD